VYDRGSSVRTFSQLDFRCIYNACAKLRGKADSREEIAAIQIELRAPTYTRSQRTGLGFTPP